MKLYRILLSLLIVFSIGCKSTNSEDDSKAVEADWKLSMQSYTFHLFTVEEAIDKTKELGLSYIEIYPGQRMGEEFGENVTFGYGLSKDQREQLKDLAKSKGVKIVSSGVWTPTRDEWEDVFSFAKDMEMEFISAEPAREDWDVVDEYAVKYNIKVSCHNHPNENSYWKPEILLGLIEGKSDLLGSCADVGHYKRMGVDPIEALTELEGKLISMHFKDIGPESENEEVLEDVVWGTGVLNVKGMLEELKRQEFKGYFTIEYENNWENNLPQIRESVDYFKEVTKELF